MNTVATIVGAGVPDDAVGGVIVLVSAATVVAVVIWIILQVRGVLRSDRSNDADESETEAPNQALNSAGPFLTARAIMTAKSFARLAAIVFALGALAQFLRIAMGWEIVVNGTPLPYWPNWIAVVVLAGLSLLGFRAAASSRPPR